MIGRGGFGIVYLAYDDQLDRSVAIKVPHARQVSDDRITKPHLAEARTVAHLEHPHIVPVYDVGGIAYGRGYRSATCRWMSNGFWIGRCRTWLTTAR